MNNKIKEILEFKEDADYKGLSIEDIMLLQECITNLQEENKELNDDNIWWNNRFKAVERDNRDYKQEIEELKAKLELYENGVYFSSENDELQERIDKANKILSNILIIKDIEHEGRYRPVKNTSSQDVYKAIIMLNELFETPFRTNYGLLQGSDKE